MYGLSSLKIDQDDITKDLILIATDGTDLIEKIIELLVINISPNNCLTLWKICKRYNSKKSFEVHDFVLYNLNVYIFKSVDLLYSWYKLDINEVELILSDSYLNVKNEFDVWALAVLWINVNKKQRSEYSNRLSNLLRFDSIDDAEAFILNEKSKLLPKNFIKTLKLSVKNKRIPRDVIAIFGGARRGQRQVNLNFVEIFDKRKGEWRKCKVLSGINNTSNCLVVIDEKIFTIGGRSGKSLMSVIKPTYSNLVAVWEESAPMHGSRTYAAACVNNKIIYVLGGYFSDDVLRTAEKYDPRSNQWTNLPNMTIERSSFAAVALNGKIYAIGGTNGQMLLDSVDVYDEELGVWTIGQPLLNAKKAHSAVVWNNGILVAGGLCEMNSFNLNGDLVSQNSTEFFDPKKNKWISMPEMNYSRFHFSMVIFDDEVYAIGGQSSLDSPLDIVEKFDGSEWQVHSVLTVPRGYHKACVLKNWPTNLLGDKNIIERKKLNLFE